MSGNSASCMVMVPGDLTAALHARSRDMDVTLFATLLSAYALLLADFADQRDMLIGTPVRGRHPSEVAGLMGYFTNLLPLRMEIRSDARRVGQEFGSPCLYRGWLNHKKKKT